MHKRKDGYKKGVEDVKEDGQGVALLKAGWRKTSELTGRLPAQYVPAGAVSAVPGGRKLSVPRLWYPLEGTSGSTGKSRTSTIW